MVSIGVEALKERLQKAERELDTAIRQRELRQTELTNAQAMETSRQGYRDKLYADLLTLKVAVAEDEIGALATVLKTA